MINLDTLCSVIDSLDVPWANQGFDKADEPEPPFICLVAGYSGSSYADNARYIDWMEYEIALYTRHRDYALEKRLSDALDAVECVHALQVASISGESLIEAAFIVKVNEN